MHRVRRTIGSFSGYAIWIAFTFYKVFNPTTRYPLLWLFILSMKLIMVSRLLSNRNYFEVNGARLYIQKDLFYKDAADISDIESIELKKGLFSKSTILLKDQNRVLKFRYQFVVKEEFYEFVQGYNIKVV